MTPYALFILFALAVCTGLAIGVLWEAIDRWATRGVDRMVDDGLAAIRADDLAADVLAEVARRRAEDEAWRRIQAAVDAAAFDRMRDRIRALPEVER